MGPLDLLVPLALILWFAGARAARPEAMNDYGLLPALPVVFFVALGVLVGSIVAALLRPALSPVRLGLHLGALVVMLHGTMPLVFSDPIYPWVYKHVGVVGYINLHGSVDTVIDIYHNWPGFFAPAAWFTRIAGVSSPLDYAAWAPVYFNLLICLELGFVFRSLPVTQRARWTGLFIFVVGNWIGQDYFAPQAAAFVLSLAVNGMVLAWLQVDRPVAAVRLARRIASRVSRPRTDGGLVDDGPAPFAPPRAAAIGAIFLVFSVVVVTHQLSPYVVLLGLGALAAAGVVRPRWVVVGLAAVTIAYFVAHLAYIERTQDLFSSLGDPFGNVHDPAPDDSVVMIGRRLTALAAPAIIICLWTLAMVGVVRRLRNGRPTLALALLAFSPTLIALGQSYGGEAIFRIYLFSLPWIAVLGASALDPSSLRRRFWPAVTIGVVLSASVVMFLSAFYGAAELYVVRPGEAQASQYFYDHAEPGGVLTLVASAFPTRVGDRYNEFGAAGDNPPVLLTARKDLRHRVLSPADLPAVAEFVGERRGPEGGTGYLVLSTSQQVFAEVLGLLPPGSVHGLDAALAAAPDWRLFYRNSDAAIYRFAPEAADGSGTPPPDALGGPGAGAPHPARARDRSVDLAGVATGFMGLAAVGLVLRRRRSVAVDLDLDLDLDEGAPQETRPPPSVEDLLRRAMGTPAYDRGPYRVAIGDLVPEPGQIGRLVASVPVGHRPDAVRLLVEAWGPVRSADLRPLLRDASAPVRAAALAAVDPSAGDVEVLIELLGDDLSADVRLAVVAALARAPEPVQLEALGVALADPDPAVRASAVETLPVARTSRAATQLLAAADDGHPDVREAAYRRLASASSWVLWMALDRCSRRPELLGAVEEEMTAEALGALVAERLSSPEVADRVLALALIGHLSTPNLLARAVEAMADAEAPVRLAAAAHLAGHGPAVHRLAASLRDDPDPAVRRQAGLALAGTGDEAALLGFVGALQDPDVEVRTTAVDALLRHPSPGLARRLAAGLTSANLTSAGEVLLGMGTLGQDALAVAVVEGSPARASAASELLRRTSTTTRLRADLRAVDPAVRQRAVEVLATVGGPDAEAGLVAALGDAVPAIRSRAARGLGRLDVDGGRHAVQRVAAFDPSPEVAEAAAEALLAMNDRAWSSRV